MQFNAAKGRMATVHAQTLYGLSRAASKAWCSNRSVHEELVAANGLLLNVQPSSV